MNLKLEERGFCYVLKVANQPFDYMQHSENQIHMSHCVICLFKNYLPQELHLGCGRHARGLHPRVRHRGFSE